MLEVLSTVGGNPSRRVGGELKGPAIQCLPDCMQNHSARLFQESCPCLFTTTD